MSSVFLDYSGITCGTVSGGLCVEILITIVLQIFSRADYDWKEIVRHMDW